MTSVEPSHRRISAAPHPEDAPPELEPVESAITAGALTDQFGGMGQAPDELWLSRMAHFASTVEGIASGHGGAIIGCLPTGVLIQHPAGNASDAVNAAIDALEALGDDVDCSFGIATGTVRMAGGVLVGRPLATASRLCAAATAGAILVDHTTVSYANLSQVRSDAGRRDHRRPADYITGSHFLPVGSGLATAYSEVLWGERTHGLDPQAVTDATLATLARLGPPLVGTVRSWDAAKQRGFVVARSGEFFYVDDRFLVQGPPEVGDTVVFVAIAPVVRGKNRVAAAMVIAPRPCIGTALDSDAGRVFVARDPQGNRVVLPFTGGAMGPTTAYVRFEGPTQAPIAEPGG